MDAAEPGTIGGTYGGNPVVCAASLANIAVMETKDLNRRAEAVGAIVRARFEKLRASCDVVADVRGLGAMIGLECCYDRDPAKPATEVVKKATARCREQGVLVITAGPFGNVIRVLSPLVISDEDLEPGAGRDRARPFSGLPRRSLLERPLRHRGQSSKPSPPSRRTSPAWRGGSPCS